MEIPVLLIGVCDSRFLKQVVGDEAVDYLPVGVDFHFEVFAEPTAVVVPEGFGVSKSF